MKFDKENYKKSKIYADIEKYIADCLPVVYENCYSECAPVKCMMAPMMLSQGVNEVLSKCELENILDQIDESFSEMVQARLDPCCWASEVY